MSKQNKTQQWQDDMYENIAAISAELWTKNSKFYERHGAALGGFPGVWRFAIDAARIFTDAEHELKGKASGESYEYLEAIEDYASSLRVAKELPTQSELKALAQEAINNARN
jgi:hypothetical protein